MSNQTKYDSFRKTFPEFVYEDYRYDVQSDGLHIVFTFRMGDNICFQPTAHIPNRSFLDFDQPAEVMDTLVFNIGMIELVSYWKCACPPRVTVRCGSLSEDQILFWKKLYYNGLGEFFYTNGISANVDDFMNISTCECVNSSPIQAFTHSSIPNSQHYIVPIGGGKDSVVSLRLLKDKNTPLIMNPRGATVGCIETMSS